MRIIEYLCALLFVRLLFFVFCTDGCAGCFSRHRINVNGVERSCLLFVPDGLTQSSRVPLLFLFHGAGGSPAGVESQTRFSRIASRERFIVCYPAAFRYWNDGRVYGTRLNKVLAARGYRADDAGFVTKLLELLKRKYPVDSCRIYAAGMSNGGMFALALPFFRPGVFAAVASVSGALAGDLLRKRPGPGPVSIMMINGTADPIVSYYGRVKAGRAGALLSVPDTVRAWLSIDRCPRRSLEKRYLPDRCPDDGTRVQGFYFSGGPFRRKVVLLKVHGGGHGWPRYRKLGPLWRRLIGRRCRDIEAAAEIWSFLREESLWNGDDLPAAPQAGAVR